MKNFDFLYWHEKDGAVRASNGDIIAHIEDEEQRKRVVQHYNEMVEAQIPEGTNDALEFICDNEELLEVGRQAVEAELIHWRDERLSEFGRNNGLICKEKDGTMSTIIRFGPEMGIRIGLKAIVKHLRSVKNGEVTNG